MDHYFIVFICSLLLFSIILLVAIFFKSLDLQQGISELLARQNHIVISREKRNFSRETKERCRPIVDDNLERVDPFAIYPIRTLAPGEKLSLHTKTKSHRLKRNRNIKFKRRYKNVMKL